MERMWRRVSFICIIILTVSFTILYGQKRADLFIENAQVNGDIFSWEIHITAYDWGTPPQNFLGDCSWYFDFNEAALASPVLSYIHPSLAGFEYSNTVAIVSDKVAITTDYQFSTPFALTMGTKYHVYTIDMTISDPAQQSQLYWDPTNTGIFNVLDSVIVETYFNNGDISLPVELATFTATIIQTGVDLKWVTESEIGNMGFEVFRSLEEKGEYVMISSYEYNESLRGHGNSSSRHEYTYRDELVVGGQDYWYKLVDVAVSGERSEHGPVNANVLLSDDRLISVSANIPTEFKLHQNYPNPFNPTTRLRFDIPLLKAGQQQVSLVIYNSLGQVVRRLYSGDIGAGSFEIEWDGHSEFGNQVPTGIYFALFKSENYREAVRLILMK